MYLVMISVPSAGPENVSAEVMSSTSVNVSWAGVPKFERNGMIQGYKVRIEGLILKAPRKKCS